MRICIPTFLTTSKKAGIAFYTVNLVDALQQTDRHNEYIILTYEGNDDMFRITNPNFKKIKIPFREKNRLSLRLFIMRYHALVLPRFVKKWNIDLVHIPSTWFVSSSIPTVITIHDIVEFKVKRYGKLFSAFKQSMVRSAIKNAPLIITVSENSKKDLCAIGARPSQVLVTYNGVDNPLPASGNAADTQLLQGFGLTQERYFIFVGTAQHHKNIPTLIRAFQLFAQKQSGYKLVLVGKMDNAAAEINRTISETGLGNDVCVLHYLDDNTKEVLLRHATAFVFVSLYEGFGMPILEANQQRLPLIVSNSSCLPEIAGDTALYVNPLSPADICNSMLLLATDGAVRQRLMAAAPANLLRFSWPEAAEKTVQAYEAVNGALAKTGYNKKSKILLDGK